MVDVRWQKAKVKGLPSPSAISRFHNAVSGKTSSAP